MTTLPRLNLIYWLLMLMCTTMGELIGNLISRNFEFGYAQGALVDVLVFSITIFAILALRFRREAFYWILILMGNIGGTNLADWVTLEPLAKDRTWGLLKPLELGTKMGSLAVLIALVAVLVAGAVATRHKSNRYFGQILYWAAILLSSTFGTTSGDLITNDTPLGALGGSIALIALLLVVYAGYRAKFLSGMAAYWAALVVVHPVGATIGNYVSKPIGLNLGNVYTNIALILLFLIVYAADGRMKREAPSANH